MQVSRERVVLSVKKQWDVYNILCVVIPGPVIGSLIICTGQPRRLDLIPPYRVQLKIQVHSRMQFSLMFKTNKPNTKIKNRSP